MRQLLGVTGGPNESDLRRESHRRSIYDQHNSQVAYKFSWLACVLVSPPAHLGQAISVSVGDHGPVHVKRTKVCLVLLVTWLADITASSQCEGLRRHRCCLQSE